MLEQRDLELIGQIVKKEVDTVRSELRDVVRTKVDTVRSDLRDVEKALSSRMDTLEGSIKDTENLLMEEIGRTQRYLEKKFSRDINDFKSENKKEHDLIMSYYRSSRSEQATIDSMQEGIFDLYNRVEKLEAKGSV